MGTNSTWSSYKCYYKIKCVILCLSSFVPFPSVLSSPGPVVLFWCDIKTKHASPCSLCKLNDEMSDEQSWRCTPYFVPYNSSSIFSSLCISMVGLSPLPPPPLFHSPMLSPHYSSSLFHLFIPLTICLSPFFFFYSPVNRVAVWLDSLVTESLSRSLVHKTN